MSGALSLMSEVGKAAHLLWPDETHEAQLREWWPALSPHDVASHLSSLRVMRALTMDRCGVHFDPPTRTATRSAIVRAINLLKDVRAHELEEAQLFWEQSLQLGAELAKELRRGRITKRERDRAKDAHYPTPDERQREDKALADELEAAAALAVAASAGQLEAGHLEAGTW